MNIQKSKRIAIKECELHYKTKFDNDFEIKQPKYFSFFHHTLRSKLYCSSKVFKIKYSVQNVVSFVDRKKSIENVRH